MKKAFFLIVCFCITTIVQAQQPYAKCFHPEDLKTWTPGADPNDVFNRSTTALQPRFVDKTIKANPNSSFSAALIAPDLTLTKDCSKGYSQGKNSFDEMFIFNYWQYVDMIIWWGGSADEGVFICPTASAIDAAHKNGVKILGNIFFAPDNCGGQDAWVEESLAKDQNGNYIIADKLIEVANYYGFDGWFLNEETTGFNNKAEWEKFCAYYSSKCDLELQMYQASSTFDSSVSWTLRDGSGQETGTSYFVNYAGTRGIDTHLAYAETIGVESWQLFYGINQGSSAFSGSSGINSVLPKGNHKASLAPFLERATWRQGNSEEQYELDESYIHSFFRYSTKYWTGSEEGNVEEDRSALVWPGIANYIPSRTHIQNKPFVTNFNSGYGIRRNIKGVDKGVSAQKWVHQAMQDVLPTWRWWWQDAANKELSCDLTLEDAYEGGTSIKVTGNLNANDANEVRLYKTKLAVGAGDVFKLVFKNKVAGKSNIKVGLAFAEDNNAFTYLDAGDATGGWDVKSFDLSAYVGKTISMISLKFESTEAVTAFTSYIGQMAVMNNAGYSCSLPSGLNVQKQLGVSEGDIRLTWTPSTGDVQHYNVYFEQDGVKTLVGQTPSCAFYIDKIARTNTQESGVKLYVAAVTKDFEETDPAILDLQWQAVPSPEVKIKTTSSFAQANEEITFTAIATNYPKTYEWIMPTDAIWISENADKSQVVYKFPNEGVYDITVAVGNDYGTTNHTVAGLVTINNTDVLENVALNKTIADYNDHIGSEVPEKLIDGVKWSGGSEKWCVGGSKEHFVIIDLEETYSIYNTVLYDCLVNESGSNLPAYRAYVSNDCTEGSWKEIYNETDRTAENIKTDHFAGIKARYVKLVPYDNTEALTVRLWEYEIFGLAGPLTIDQAVDLTLDKGEKKNVSVNFQLNGEEKADDFSVEVLIPNSEDQQRIVVSNIKVNEGNVTFDLEGMNYGSGTFLVRFTNDGWVVTTTAEVSVMSSAWENLALNRPVDRGDGSTYGDESGDITNVVDGDLQTYWSSRLRVKKFIINLERKCDIHWITAKYTSGIGLYEGRYNVFPSNVTVKYSEDGVAWKELTADVIDGKLDELTDGIQAQYLELLANFDGYYDHIGLYEVIVRGVESTATAVDDKEANDQSISVSPNPLTAASVIKLDLPVAGDVSVDIYNLAGAKVAQVNTAHLSAGKQTISLDEAVVSKLKAGVYLMVVKTPAGQHTLKVLKR